MVSTNRNLKQWWQMGITYRECPDLPLIIAKGSPGNSHTSPVKNHSIKAKYKNSDLVKESLFFQQGCHRSRSSSKSVRRYSTTQKNPAIYIQSDCRHLTGRHSGFIKSQETPQWPPHLLRCAVLRPERVWPEAVATVVYEILVLTSHKPQWQMTF